MRVAFGGMRSLVACGLFAGVVLAIATPAGPERVLRDPGACAAWQREYHAGCVVPSGQLPDHDDGAAYDARRVLRAGCQAITERATAACSTLRPVS